MSYNPGGQPPYYQQQYPPQPPPKSGMSTGAKLAIFGCLGLVVILAIPSIGLLVWYAMQDSTTVERADKKSTSSDDKKSSTDVTKDDDDDDSTNDASTGSGTYISTITLARDDGSGSAGEEVTSFKPSDNPMHFVIKLNGSYKGKTVRIVLTAIDAGPTPNMRAGDEINRKLNSFENSLDAHWTLASDWPTGNYKVEAYVDGSLDKSLKFRVKS